MNQVSTNNSIRRQRFTGTVVSDKMKDTVVVELKRRVRHPKYHKSYTVTKRVQAHSTNGAKVGDSVVIESTRPISKMKRFRVVN